MKQSATDSPYGSGVFEIVEEALDAPDPKPPLPRELLKRTHPAARRGDVRSSIAIALLAVLAWAACNNDPGVSVVCRGGEPSSAGGGGDPQVGTVGIPVEQVMSIGVQVQCDGGLAEQPTRVDVSVLDPQNARISATATAPEVQFNTVLSTVTFTPMTAGPYHLTARFEPNLGSAQLDLQVQDAGP